MRHTYLFHSERRIEQHSGVSLPVLTPVGELNLTHSRLGLNNAG